jgi:hypothetical protein
MWGAAGAVVSSRANTAATNRIAAAIIDLAELPSPRLIACTKALTVSVSIGHAEVAVLLIRS